MKDTCNSRNFIKITLAIVLNSHIFFSGVNSVCASDVKKSRVIVFESPGGGISASSDYEITLKRGGKTWKPFTYYSYSHSVDKVIDQDAKYLKNPFLELHAYQSVQPQKNKDTYAHSWAYFDFEGGPIEVEIKISKNVEGLNLPLKSCGIFPSNLGIKCKIIGGDIVRFTLDKPVKIAIVPNYLQALEKMKKGDSMQAFDGYRNPFFLFARAPETNIPNKNAPGTLVIKPGQMYGPDAFDKATTIYFEPGVHDYSKYNPADQNHYILLKTGQTMYLAGGAYVYGHVSSQSKNQLISDMPLLRGRGTISGVKNIWTGTSYLTTEIRNVKLDGINMVDRNNHVSHSNSPFRDIAVVGGWHGNTDGVTVEGGVEDDPYSGWNVEDCFVMAGDTNLKFQGSARIKNYTIWQLGNAEPFWISDSKDSYVDGVQVICYNKAKSITGNNPGQIVNFTVPDSKNMKNITVKNIYCEAPFASRLFLIQSIYTGEGSACENVLFENCTFITPHIILKSIIGKRDANCSPFGKVTFRNLVINGKKVTNENCTDYFDLLQGVTIGKELVFE